MNRVLLRGLVNVRKSFPAHDDKKALVFASIRPAGEKGSVDVKAFGETAEKLGNSHELTVECEGRISYEKPKEKTDKRWPMIVVIERVTEVAPRGHEPEEPF